MAGCYHIELLDMLTRMGGKSLDLMDMPTRPPSISETIDNTQETQYNPTNKASEPYKKYKMPFSHSMTEQWLKFMENLTWSFVAMDSMKMVMHISI